MKTAMASLMMVLLLAGSSGHLGLRSARADDLPPCHGRDEAMLGRDGWEAIPAPAFPQGDAELSGYAVDPYDPRLLLVTNGSVIMRSTDGGCRFQPVFTPTPSSGSIRARIERLIVPDHRSAYDSIYAIVNMNLSPRVFSSEDGGLTWSDRSEGLTIVGSVVDLVFSPSDPETGYLLVDAAPAGSLVYVTRDGGASWSTSSDPATEVLGVVERVGVRFNRLAVSPTEAMHLFATSENGLFSSADGAKTWVSVQAVNSALDGIDIALDAPHRILVFAPEGKMYWSEDDGGSWDSAVTPGSVQSAIQLQDDVGVASDATAASVYVARRPFGAWRPVTALRPPFRDLYMDREDLPRFYAYTSSAVMRSAGIKPAAQPPQPTPTPTPAATEPCEDRAISRDITAPAPVIDAASLSPQRERIVLAPGQEKIVDYDLDLPPRPTLLDAFFLIDTTGSMASEICGIRVGLADMVHELAARGIPVHIGVGEFRDYPIPPFGHPQDWAYRRDRLIGPVVPELMDALAALKAGNGGDGPEATLSALYQSVTGAGHQVADAPSHADIPRGQEAGFRDGNLKVIVNVTDADFHDDPGYPGSTWDQTLGALRSENVRQVGISVEGPGGFEDLVRVAKSSHTLAPEGGVDCTGDGAVDLEKGMPLVCRVGSEESDAFSIAPAIAQLLASVRDLQTVRLLSDSPAVEGIAPQSFPGVDVKKHNALDFEVTYRCGFGDAGRIFPVDLRASVGRAPVASSRATVICAAPTIPPPAGDNGGILVLGSQTAPLLQNVHQPQPQPRVHPEPQPNPQPNSQAQAQANAVAVAQRQEQPQMAFVHAAQSLRDQTALQNAMISSRSKRSGPLDSLRGLGAGTIGLLLLYGFSSMLQTQVRTARQNIRRLR